MLKSSAEGEVIFMRSDELYHYGVKGMKWGVRRYQNADGSYTDDGKRRYGRGSGGRRVGGLKELNKQRKASARKAYSRDRRDILDNFGDEIKVPSYLKGKAAERYVQSMREVVDYYKANPRRVGAYKTLSDGRIGKTNWAPNYSESQRAEDRRVYSRGAVRRINKRLLNGETIKGSRSAEADRIHRYRSASNIAGKIGSAVGTVAGGAGAYYLSRKFGHGSLRDPIAVGAASMGAGIGNAVGRSIGGRGTMILGGYGRKRRR